MSKPQIDPVLLEQSASTSVTDTRTNKRKENVTDEVAATVSGKNKKPSKCPQCHI
jgi:hypothetical protein